jgi:hypothetical protein
MVEEWLKVIHLSSIAWLHINMIGIHEFYNDKECRNLHEVIEKLVCNKKSIYWLQPRLVKSCRGALGNFVP